MDNVTAAYTQNPDGTIRIKNKGYDYIKKEWKESAGEARFVKNKTEARLKVSFFKPFWTGYNVIDIDENYQYALVAGSSLKYLLDTVPYHSNSRKHQATFPGESEEDRL